MSDLDILSRLVVMPEAEFLAIPDVDIMGPADEPCDADPLDAVMEQVAPAEAVSDTATQEQLAKPKPKPKRKRAKRKSVKRRTKPKP
jgi:hypothetical protein